MRALARILSTPATAPFAVASALALSPPRAAPAVGPDGDGRSTSVPADDCDDPDAEGGPHP